MADVTEILKTMAGMTELQKARKVNEILKSRISNHRNLITDLISRQITAEATKAGASKIGLPDIQRRAQKVFKTLEDGTGIEAQDERGIPLYEGGQKMKINEWVKKLVPLAPHLFISKDHPQGKDTTDLEGLLAQALEKKDIQAQIRLKRLIFEARQRT